MSVLGVLGETIITGKVLFSAVLHPLGVVEISYTEITGKMKVSGNFISFGRKIDHSAEHRTMKEKFETNRGYLMVGWCSIGPVLSDWPGTVL